MTADRRTRRLGVLAHFDPDGEVAPHVRRTVEAVERATSKLVIVSTSELTPDAHAWLNARGLVITRANTGHDFASYQAGLDAVDGEFDQVLLLNDSAVLPLTPISRIFATMSARRVDFWGLTPGFGFAPHVQSYFMVFERSALDSPAWRSIWESVGDSGGREEIILRHEVGLTALLTAAGLRSDTYFRPTPADRVRGAARAHAAELGEILRGRRWRAVAGWLRRLPSRVRNPEWNPAVALTDLALRHPDAFPAVKISTLRDDAYALGSAALLDALEARHPEAFEGVRDYLARTDGTHDGRWSATLTASSGPLRYRLR